MRTFTFAVFELQESTGLLLRGETRVPLPEQAFQVLRLLCRSGGEPVSREELRQELWPGRPYGDFEAGLNSAVRKLRRALGDGGSDPALVGTLPRRGYRLLVPVNEVPPRLDRRDASIVVLPFADLSPDPENAFFADGLTEELIAELSQVRTLRVISRTSAMACKGTGKPLPLLARELGVGFVLEGSVRKEGARLRVTAQLIEAAQDDHLWAETYVDRFEQVLDIQERIARRIVASLRIALSPDEERRLAARPIQDGRALEAYLRAMQLVRTFGEPGLDEALRLTGQALALVGDLPLLHAAQALIHWQYHNAGFRPTEETLYLADRSAGRALDLDPACSRALLAKGLVAWTRGGLGAAAHYLARSAELDRNSEALTFLSSTLALTGNCDAARTHAEAALREDPLNPWALWGRAQCELLAGDLEAAEARYRFGLALAPEDPLLLGFLAMTTLYAGPPERARGHFEVFKARVPSYGALADMYLGALAGDRRAVLANAGIMAPYAKRDREMSWCCADALAMVGEKAQALRWLEQAVDLGFVHAAFFTQVDRALAPLHRDPRFAVLMAKAREQQARFRTGAVPVEGFPDSVSRSPESLGVGGHSRH